MYTIRCRKMYTIFPDHLRLWKATVKRDAYLAHRISNTEVQAKNDSVRMVRLVRYGSSIAKRFALAELVSRLHSCQLCVGIFKFSNLISTSFPERCGGFNRWRLRLEVQALHCFSIEYRISRSESRWIHHWNGVIVFKHPPNGPTVTVAIQIVTTFEHHQCVT